MSVQTLRKKARQWFFETFPEFDPGEESFSNRLMNLNLQLAALRSPPKQEPRLATVVLLMDPPPRAELSQERVAELLAQGASQPFGPPRPPRFLSGSVLLPPSNGESRWGHSEPETMVEMPIYWEIPAGSWLVAHGCKLARVHAGNAHQDTGPSSQFCQLSDPVPMGVRLTIHVKP
jgi:hypothetical protein